MTTLNTELNNTIEALINDDATRDIIIIALVTDHNVSLDKATKAYAAYAKDNGLTKVIVSHKAEALEWLGNHHAADTWDTKAVKSATVDFMDTYNVAESTARDYCKAFSKQLGVALPVADPREAIFQWFLDNDSPEKSDFIEYVTEELGRSKSNANEYWKGYELHQFLVANQ